MQNIGFPQGTLITSVVPIAQQADQAVVQRRQSLNMCVYLVVKLQIYQNYKYGGLAACEDSIIELEWEGVECTVYWQEYL